MNPNLIAEVEAIVGHAGVLWQADELLVYECDAFVAAKQRPEMVVFPTSTEQVAALVNLANRHGMNVVPRGAGTGLSGGSLAESGCIMIGLSRMNQILEVD